MKRNLLNVLKVVTASLLLLGPVGAAVAQGPGPQSVQTALGTGFTYQGELKNANGPVTGNCDFQFSLWDSLSNASGQIGTTQTKTNVSVATGLFTIPNLDFGSSAFTGYARWLQIAVKCAGDSNFTTLTPRQALMAAPYALSLRPGAVVSGTVSGAALAGQQGGTSGELGYKVCTSPPFGFCTYYGVRGTDISTSGLGVGVYASSISGTAVYAGSTNQGINAVVDGANGTGVLAEASGANGTGIKAEAAGVNGIGVYAVGATAGVKATSSAENGIGVDAQANGSTGIGVSGKGDFSGVFGSNDYYGGHGVMGFGNNHGTGVYGNGVDIGVEGASDRGIGVSATSGGADTAALRATNTNANGIAIWGTANGTDSTMVLEHDGTAGSDFIRAYRTTPTNAFVFSVGADGHITGHSLWIDNDVTVGGQTSTAVLQITGGSDLAERFNVNGKVVEPGTLMVIDDQHPGELRPSDGAYDTRVAGVVSGAGGVQPGLTLQQQGVMEGDTSIAIAGRVYVRAEALSASIEPGDLLTSSSLPGHAMKAMDKDRSYGAIIGKAMTGLKTGTGLVLVLVNLQ